MRHHEAKPIRCDEAGCFNRATRTRGFDTDLHQVCARHMSSTPGHWYGTLDAVCRVCGKPIKPFRATFWQHAAEVAA